MAVNGNPVGQVYREFVNEGKYGYADLKTVNDAIYTQEMMDAMNAERAEQTNAAAPDIDNATENGYNNDVKEGADYARTDEFRGVQTGDQGVSEGNVPLYGNGNQSANETVRRRAPGDVRGPVASKSSERYDRNQNARTGYARTDEFRRLQEESKRMSDKDTQLYHSGERKIDEGLRRRFSRSVQSIFLDPRNNVVGDGNGLLNFTAKGNTFNVYDNVDGELFHDVFEMARNYLKYGELVDLHEVQTTEDGIGYDDCYNYLSEDGLSGFSITPDGDLISVFNASGRSGFLKAITPIVKEKAKTLDCYISPLQNLQSIYSEIFGFKTASVMGYNMEYDHDNIAKNHAEPYISFMVNTDADLKFSRYFNENQYDEAVEYRNRYVKRTDSARAGSDFSSKKTKADSRQQKESPSGKTEQTESNSYFKEPNLSSQGSRNRLFYFCKKLGIQLDFDYTGPGDGVYLGNGRISLKPATADPLKFVFKHELVHFLQESKKFPAFLNDLLNKSPSFQAWLEAQNTDLQSMRLELVDRYKKCGVDLAKSPGANGSSYRGADFEIAANFVGDQLFGSNAGEVTDGFLKELAQNNRNIFQRILDFFKSRIAMIGKNNVQRDLIRLEQMLIRLKETVKVQKNTATEGEGASYSIVKDNYGDSVVKIDTDQGLFVGVDESEYRKIVRNYLNEHFKDTVLPLSDYNLVSVGKTGIGKYTYSGKKIENSANNAKMKAATELDNLLQTSEYIDGSDDRKNHNFANDGFDYYRTRFIVDGSVFEGIIDIGVSEKGAVFYGMTHIENVTSRYYGRYSDLLSGYKSVTQSDTSNNRVTQSNSIVNTYSMQEDENNSQNGQNSISAVVEKLTDEEIFEAVNNGQISSDDGIRMFKERYGEMEHGVNPQADETVPKQTTDDNRVNRFARTSLESGKMSEEAVERVARQKTTADSRQQKESPSGKTEQTKSNSYFKEPNLSIQGSRNRLFYFCKKLGIQLDFDYTGPGDGVYLGNGRISLKPATADPLKFVFKHELVHFLQESKKFPVFLNDLLNKSPSFQAWLEAQNTDLQSMRLELVDRYKKCGVDLAKSPGANGSSYRGADFEIAANFVGDQLFGSNDGEVTDDFLKELAQNNRNIFQRILDFFKSRIAMVGKNNVQRDLIRLEQKLIRLKETVKVQKNTANEGGAKYSLGKYSNKQMENWKNSKRIILFESQKQLNDFIEKSLSGEIENKKMYFGTVTSELAKRIYQDTNISVENYNVSLSSNEIRKINKDHGNIEQEMLRGQKAVSASDYSDILLAIQEPSQIQRSEKDYFGKPAIIFKSDNITVVAVVSDKHLDLFIQTAYIGIKKGNLATPTAEQAAANTPKASSGTVSNNSISKNDTSVNTQYMQENENNSENQGQYSIAYTTDNKPVVVVENNILDGVPKNKWIETVKNEISNKFSRGIPVSGRLIKVNAITRNEYTKSKYSQYLKTVDGTVYADKFKSVNNLDEIVLASTDYINEDLKHERKDSFKEFARGDVLIRVDNNDYFAKVIVGFTSGNQMVLYDVIDFSPAKFTLKKQRTSQGYAQEGAGSLRKGTFSINTTIPQKAQSVNIYSMQEDENNSENGQNSIPAVVEKLTSEEIFEAVSSGKITAAEGDRMFKERYGEMEHGVNPQTDETVPKQTTEENRVNRFARTSLESGKMSAEAIERAARQKTTADSRQQKESPSGKTEQTESNSYFKEPNLSSQGSRNRLFYFCKKLGIQLDFDYTGPGDGVYLGNGRISLKPATADPLKFVFKHELVHFLQESKKFPAFLNDLLNKSPLFQAWLAAQNTDLQSMRLELVDRYKKCGVDLAKSPGANGSSYRGADFEIAANFVGDQLFVSNAGEVTDGFLKELAQNNRNIFQRILDFFKSRIAMIGKNNVQRDLIRLEQKLIRLKETVKVQKSSASEDGAGYGLANAVGVNAQSNGMSAAKGEKALTKSTISNKIEIDELTPCLRRMKDNKIVDTEIFKIAPKKSDFKNWEFDWSLPEKDGNSIYALKAIDDQRVQGLIALKEDKRNLAVHVDIVESAPFNNPHHKYFIRKEYKGVGGHLFAEAVKQSYKAGFGGAVYFTAKSDLIEHYQKELGAILTNPRLRIMFIDEEAAKKLYDRYYGGNI